MLRGELKPLTLTLWLEEVAELAAWCAHARGEADRAVRRAFHLSKLAPLALRNMFAPALLECELELMLERGQIDAAAATVTGLQPELERTHTSTAQSYRTEFTVGDGEPVHFEAASPSLALIGAWASFLAGSQGLPLTRARSIATDAPPKEGCSMEEHSPNSKDVQWLSDGLKKIYTAVQDDKFDTLLKSLEEAGRADKV